MTRHIAISSALFLMLLGKPIAAGVLTGSVDLAIEGVNLSDLGEVVAFIEETGREKMDLPVPPAATIRQTNANFEPDFLVVSVGQPIEMPNLDGIFHNVFSFSKPNDFDLGLYPNGESRTLTFKHPGVVRIYCSIHESMSGLILVAPTPWFATVDGKGRFSIADLPAGDYRLTLWNERLPMVRRRFQIPSGGNARVDVVMGDESP